MSHRFALLVDEIVSIRVPFLDVNEDIRKIFLEFFDIPILEELLIENFILPFL